jgi:hypothetical protein
MKLLTDIQKQLQRMDKALISSFANLKHDISSHRKSLELLNSRIAEQDKLLDQLINEMSVLKEQKQTLKTESQQQTEQVVFGERSVSSVKCSEGVLRTPNSLTPLHLELLRKLMLLQVENGSRGITMRELAVEVYPDREYASIKSTLSEYIKELHQAELVEKIQNKRLYISFTEKALGYADQQRINRMKELISIAMQTVR